MKIFPVIHIANSNVELAVHEGEKAFSLGADGVILIDHQNAWRNTSPLFESVNKLTDNSNERFVGINILGLSPMKVMYAIDRAIKNGRYPYADNMLNNPPSGVWIDDMRDDYMSPDFAMETKKFKPSLKQVKILGGVAFKYTNTFTEDPKRAAYEAILIKDSVDVMVTSGAGTGIEPSVEKIRAMKNVIGSKALAIASGISIENIHKYNGIVDQLFVSSSVETIPGSGIFDERRLQELIDEAHRLAL
ncbi:MAG: BtpA/SgcQ family protein [Candidatus Saccharibacteria bacterium]